LSSASGNGIFLAKSENRTREDGRKPLLVYLAPELIQKLKQQALDQDTHVYLIVEDLVRRSDPVKTKG
jgi:hypothetical protein